MKTTLIFSVVSVVSVACLGLVSWLRHSSQVEVEPVDRAQSEEGTILFVG